MGYITKGRAFIKLGMTKAEFNRKVNDGDVLSDLRQLGYQIRQRSLTEKQYNILKERFGEHGNAE